MGPQPVRSTLEPPSLTTIQSLRGLAALAVCFAHLYAVEAKFDPSPILSKFALSGFAGVDLFFVISGFVMVWVTRSQQGVVIGVPYFWFARIVRIYPLWWVVVTAILIVWLMRPDWVYSSTTTTPDLLRSYLLLPADTLPLHAVGWTLVHEVWFYFVFGFLLCVPERYFPAVLFLWAGITIAGALLLERTADPFIKLMRHPLTLEFIMGAAIGLIARKRALPYAKFVLQTGCLLMLFAALFHGDNPNLVFEAEWPRVFYFGIPAAMIVWGMVGLEQGGYQSDKRSQALGNWSYALYLIHVPVFAALNRLVSPMSMAGPLDNVAFMIAALASALLAAWVLFNFFEKPVGRLVKGWLLKGN